MDTLDTKTLKQARIAQLALILMALPLALLYPIIPLGAVELGQEFDLPDLVAPYSVAGCLTVAAAHLFLFSTWRIVHYVATGSFYTEPVTTWVKVAKVAVIFGCLMPIGTGLHLLVFEDAGGPLMAPFVFGVITLAIAAASLLELLVELYRGASANVAELAEVI